MKAIQPYNKPVPIDVREYHRAIEAYIARVTEVEGVRSVFTMGSIKAPGLSDIDMIVVVDDDFESRRSMDLSTTGIDDRLFIHGPVVLPESMVPVLQYIIYGSGLERRSGSDTLPKFEQLDVSTANTLRMAYTIDFLASRQVQYGQVLDSGHVDLRIWMARLWSLTHSENLLRGTGVEISETDVRLLAGIRRLREVWLESHMIDEAEFVDILLRSVEANRSLWLSALNSSYERTQNGLRVLRMRADNKLFEFREEFEFCEAGSWTLRVPGRSVTFHAVAANPLYAAHLAAYGYFDRDLVPANSVLDSDCLLRRAQWVRRHQQWLSDHCPHAGSMSGYTGVNRPKAGITRQTATFLVGLVKRYQVMRL